MARLFITAKEIQYINDLNKELLQDTIGQKIYYYAISATKTKVHELYNEAINKIFEHPIILPVLAAQPTWETKHNQFGMEQVGTIEVYVLVRALIDRDLTLAEGDFFTYGDAVFEVVSYLQTNNIFGQEEYEVSYKLTGQLARPGQFDPKSFLKPRKDSNLPFEESEVQQVFIQQRGLKENDEGVTGDIRQLNERLGDDMAPIALGEGPVSIAVDSDKKSSGFVNDPLPPKKSLYDD